MKRFLRLFESYCDMEAKLVAGGGDIRGLQGEVHALRAEVEQLRMERDKATGSERRAYQTLVNVEMKTKYGFVPFQDAPAPPDRPEADMRPISTHTPIRSLVDDGNDAFRREIRQMYGGKD